MSDKPPTFFDLNFSNPLEPPQGFPPCGFIFARMTFPNGYGASVIFGPCTYGCEEGKFELAVLKNDHLCYDSGITDDVMPYLEPDDVTKLLQQIAALPESK